ncbi:hypothetical protein AMTR_s00180p00021620 [Amborella trichopoda]|uniref:Uncharacterized protein n=1 Tax=Amborella trichopoda TaxID=13333 RepID=W1PS24_AMBTC|nr:hypothetical protein AMTR_s00180p00021620 [Amborella trichopoda]
MTHVPLNCYRVRLGLEFLPRVHLESGLTLLVAQNRLSEDGPSKAGVPRRHRKNENDKTMLPSKGDYPRHHNLGANGNGTQDLWSQTVSTENQGDKILEAMQMSLKTMKMAPKPLFLETQRKRPKRSTRSPEGREDFLKLHGSSTNDSATDAGL